MKNLITGIVFIFLGAFTATNAQVCNDVTASNFGKDSVSCRQNVSIYSEFLRQKNWNEASIAWWKTQKVCPQYKTNLYKNGISIYKKKIKALDKKSPDVALMADTLLTIYDLWIENFGDCDKIQVDKAKTMMKYHPTTKFEEANNLYRKAFKGNENKLDYYNARLFMYSSVLMLKTKKADCELVLNDYDYLDKIANQKIKEYQEKGDTKKVDKWLKTQVTLEKYVDPCATCDQLVIIYKPQTDDDKENIELAEKVLAKLNKKKCTDKAYFIELLERVHAAKPTAETSMYLGNYYYGKKETSNAMKFYDEALGYESISEETKINIYKKKVNIAEKKKNYKLMTSLASKIGGCEGKYIKARAVAISATSCGSTKLERGAIYSYALKLADEASCASSSWKANIKGNLPTTGEIFAEGVKKGDSVSVPCWGTKVAIRTK